MLKRIAIRKDWTISMSEFRKFAEQYQWEIDRLEKENRNLRFELWESQTHRWVDVKDLKNKVEHQKSALKSMEKQIKELKADLEHRDSFFSIMRDVLANDEISNEELASILYCVIHLECWDYDLSKKEVEIAEKFWFRDYV